MLVLFAALAIAPALWPATDTELAAIEKTAGDAYEGKDYSWAGLCSRLAPVLPS